ncbi:MAG: cupin domain-containing protein, partial [Chloroflexi bacterium]|nr:cupin domain-containing protein [Chloroflexota bacterium]
MSLNIRRVVTANDSNGKATVWIDDVAANLRINRPLVSSVLLWSTEGTPPDVSGDEDLGARALPRPPAHRGSIFRVVEFEPGNAPDRHVTPTLDYAVVMSGEIDMELDDGAEVHLKAGDVLV